MRHPSSNQYLFITFFVLLSGLFSCTDIKSPKVNDDKDIELALKYKLKSISINEVPFKAGYPQAEQVYQTTLFDENGFKLSRVDYGSNGKIDCTVNFKYDSIGNLTESKALNLDKSLQFNETRSYDKNGNRHELIFYLPDGTYKYRNISIYDNSNKQIELDWYWPDGLKARNKFAYTGSNKSEDVEYAPDGTFRYKWVYKYDGRNNLIESIQYYPDSLINRRILNEYNAADLMVSQSTFTGEELTGKSLFEYDAKGLLTVKTDYTPMGSVKSIYRYEYQFWK